MASDRLLLTEPAMVALVSCSAKKLSRAAAARELYTSALFAKSLVFAERTCSVTYVLSAMHGLVELDRVLDPYEYSLLQATGVERAVWAARIVQTLFERHGAQAEYVVLAGDAYARPLRAAFSALPDFPRSTHLIDPDQIHEPLVGLQIGERLRWLNERNARGERVTPSFLHFEVSRG